MSNTSCKDQEKQEEIETKDYSNYTYEQVMQMIEDTRRNCQVTIQSCNKSIETIGQSMKTINETKANIDGFFDQYNKAINSLSEKISESFSGMGHCFKKNDNTDKEYEDSREANIQECVQLFKDKKKVVFLTGAGISFASGIPTFRGVGAAPLFSKDGVTYKNEEISTYAFMKNKPDIFWERNLIFLGGQDGRKYNISHLKIQQLVNQYKEIKNNQKEGSIQTQSVIVTQNTDGLHCQAFNELNPNNTSYLNKNDPQYGFCPDVFEVHGSKNYLRCDNDKCTEYEKKFEYPKQYTKYQDFICQVCKTQARPNVLYFDESYDEKNYRISTLKELIEDMDLLIVIGTQLETGFAATTVSNAVRSKIPIIEVSLTPVIQKGGLTLKGKAEEVVPQLCDKVMELNKQYLPKNIEQQAQKKNNTVIVKQNGVTQQQKSQIKISADKKKDVKQIQDQNKKRDSIKSTSSITSSNSTASNASSKLYGQSSSSTSSKILTKNNTSKTATKTTPLQQNSKNSLTQINKK